MNKALELMRVKCRQLKRGFSTAISVLDPMCVSNYHNQDILGELSVKSHMSMLLESTFGTTGK